MKRKQQDLNRYQQSQRRQTQKLDFDVENNGSLRIAICGHDLCANGLITAETRTWSLLSLLLPESRRLLWELKQTLLFFAH